MNIGVDESNPLRNNRNNNENENQNSSGESDNNNSNVERDSLGGGRPASSTSSGGDGVDSGNGTGGSNESSRAADFALVEGDGPHRRRHNPVQDAQRVPQYVEMIPDYESSDLAQESSAGSNSNGNNNSNETDPAALAAAAAASSGGGNNRLGPNMDDAAENNLAAGRHERHHQEDDVDDMELSIDEDGEASRADEEEDQEELITEPSGNDVLLGFDIDTNKEGSAGSSREEDNHPGNRIYKSVARHLAKKYSKTKTGYLRAAVQIVVNAVKVQGGRFLKRTDDGKWKEASRRNAYMYSKQAIKATAKKVQVVKSSSRRRKHRSSSRRLPSSSTGRRSRQESQPGPPAPGARPKSPPQPQETAVAKAPTHNGSSSSFESSSSQDGPQSTESSSFTTSDNNNESKPKARKGKYEGSKSKGGNSKPSERHDLEIISLRLQTKDESLTHLTLDLRKVNHDSLFAFAKALDSNEILSSLELHLAPVSLTNANALTWGIKRSRGLRQVKLRYPKKHKGSKSYIILSGVLGNPYIESLNLDRNRLDPQSIKKICDIILHSQNNATPLDRHQNNNNDNGQTGTNKRPMPGTRLQRLSLEYNPIGDEAAPPIASLITSCQSLRYINLAGNDLHSTGITILKKAIKKKKNCIFEISGLEFRRSTNSGAASSPPSAGRKRPPAPMPISSTSLPGSSTGQEDRNATSTDNSSGMDNPKVRSLSASQNSKAIAAKNNSNAATVSKNLMINNALNNAENAVVVGSADVVVQMGAGANEQETNLGQGEEDNTEAKVSSDTATSTDKARLSSSGNDDSESRSTSVLDDSFPNSSSSSGNETDERPASSISDRPSSSTDETAPGSSSSSGNGSGNETDERPASSISDRPESSSCSGGGSGNETDERSPPNKKQRTSIHPRGNTNIAAAEAADAADVGSSSIMSGETEDVMMPQARNTNTLTAPHTTGNNMENGKHATSAYTVNGASSSSSSTQPLTKQDIQMSSRGVGGQRGCSGVETDGSRSSSMDESDNVGSSETENT